MKITIDLETTDENGIPVPVMILENVLCFGLAALHPDGMIFHHHGDPIAIDSAIHGLKVCMKPHIDKVQKEMT